MGNRQLLHRNSMLAQQFMRGVKDERVVQRLAPMRPRNMDFHELVIELRQLEREDRSSSKLNVNQAPKQSVQARPQQHPSTSTKTPSKPDDKQQSQKKSDHDVLQELVLTVKQLSQKVEQLSMTSSRSQRPNQDTTRVFTCHRCGQDGHIARGCRSTPLNSQAPRSMGKPSEGQSPPAQ